MLSLAEPDRAHSRLEVHMLFDREHVDYLIEKAREADEHASEVGDPEEKSAWLTVAAFWLNLAERRLVEVGESFRTMH
jgi:hypothetical protein